ncbi:hypothetical protein HDC90_001535 [Pedobacter sp. AK013]|nr:hypothetical protein [Pedobacter sp. AK013]
MVFYSTLRLVFDHFEWLILVSRKLLFFCNSLYVSMLWFTIVSEAISITKISGSFNIVFMAILLF